MGVCVRERETVLKDILIWLQKSCKQAPPIKRNFRVSGGECGWVCVVEKERWCEIEKERVSECGVICA